MSTGERLARIGAGAPLDADDLAFLRVCLGTSTKAVQRPAADALAARVPHDPHVRRLLDEAIVADELALRWGAVYALSRSGAGVPPAGVAVLLDVLGLADGDMRWAAAAILVAMAPSTPVVVPALIALAGSGNAAQRKMALYCLRDLDVGTSEALARVHERLADDDVGVRLGAMAALARLAPALVAASAIAERLADADAGVRRTAAATLGRLGVADAPVVDALRAVIESDDAMLARTAQRAVDKLARDRLG